MSEDEEINGNGGKISNQIARLDERQRSVKEELGKIAESVQRIETTINSRIVSIYDNVDKLYVKKADFDPIKKLVYGFVGFLLLMMGGMFVAVIVKSGIAPNPITSPTQIIQPHDPPGAQIR